jgi:hypothetical protein
MQTTGGENSVSRKVILSTSKSPNAWSQKITSKREASSTIRRPLPYHQFPESMSDIHNVFHVSQLRKCLKVLESHIAEESVQIQKDLQYIEKPVKILDSAIRKTRNSEVRLSKVQWSREGEEEAT